MHVRRWVIASLFVFIPLAGSAAPFPDASRYPLANDIETLHARGIVQGYPDGTYKPNNTINRAEFLAILLRSLPYTLTTSADHHCFADFVGAEQWYWVYACQAKDAGIVQGYPDGSFGGTRSINTVEALKMSLHAWKIPLPVYIRAPDHWYDPYVIVAMGLGIFDFLPDYPSHLITRGEMAAMILRIAPSIADLPPISSSSASSVSSGFPPPVMRGALQLAQVSSSSGQVVPGQNNVTFLAFDALAANQDVRIGSLTFKASEGSLSSVSTIRLQWNGGAVSGVVNGDTVVFFSPPVVLRVGSTVRMSVVADVLPAAQGTLRITFATDTGQYASAQENVTGQDLGGVATNGVCPSPSVCHISVQTMSSGTVSTGGRAMLYITQDNVSVPGRQLLLGQKSDALMRLNFHASGEDVALTGLVIGGATDATSSLELWQDGSMAPFAVATSGQCASPAVGQFCITSANDVLVIPRDSDKHVFVKANIRGENEGGRSGLTATLAISTQAMSVHAYGRVSHAVLSDNSGGNGQIIIGRSNPGLNIPITGPTHDLVAAKITNITNSSNDPDNTQVPVSTTAIGRFRVSTDIRGVHAVTIHSLTFTVASAGITFDTGTFGVATASNSSHVSPCTASVSSTITVHCTDLDTSDIGAVAVPGGFVDVLLQAKINSASPGSFLQTSLNLLDDRNSPGTITWDDGSVPFQWVEVPAAQVRSTLYRS